MNKKLHVISLKRLQQFFNASTDTPHIPSRTITIFRFFAFVFILVVLFMDKIKHQTYLTLLRIRPRSFMIGEPSIQGISVTLATLSETLPHTLGPRHPLCLIEGL